MLPERFRCYLVTKDSAGNVTGEITERRSDELPDGEAVIRVAYSALNYKDALGATGHPGINKTFPNIPGVDAAGVIADSGVYEMVEGDPVICTGFDMGSNRWGGFAEYVSVPLDWIVPLPEDLTLRESMILGTGGFTAGLCIDALQKHGVEPGGGEVVVTGASGGVGSMAVAILAKLGYEVVAVTGKTSAHEFLTNLGASRIVGREEVDDTSDRPMLKGRWAGAIDTVGGNTLTTILRATKHDGCVTAIGLVAGDQLSMTVYPFILRAIALTGIDAAWCPLPIRHETWQRLAGDWKPDNLESIATEIELAELPTQFDKILAGKITGRVLVKVGGEDVEEET